MYSGWDTDVTPIKKKRIFWCVQLCASLKHELACLQRFSPLHPQAVSFDGGEAVTLPPTPSPCLTTAAVWRRSAVRGARGTVGGELRRRQEGTAASSLSSTGKIRQLNNRWCYVFSAICPKAQLPPARSSPKPHGLAAR